MYISDIFSHMILWYYSIWLSMMSKMTFSKCLWDKVYYSYGSFSLSKQRTVKKKWKFFFWKGSFVSLLSSAKTNYCKWEKNCWLNFFAFFMVLRSTAKVFRKYKCLSLTVLNNEYLWPRQCKTISVKTLMALKLEIFSPANLSLSTVWHHFNQIFMVSKMAIMILV